MNIVIIYLVFSFVLFANPKELSFDDEISEINSIQKEYLKNLDLAQFFLDEFEENKDINKYEKIVNIGKGILVLHNGAISKISFIETVISSFVVKKEELRKLRHLKNKLISIKNDFLRILEQIDFILKKHKETKLAQNRGLFSTKKLLSQFSLLVAGQGFGHR